MAGMGPAPKHPDQRRRQNASIALTQLPAGGREGDVPVWPLGAAKSPSVKSAELELWKQLWATPQAVMWERNAWTRTVARYCRLAIAAEKPKALGAVLTETRQLEDRLGLSPMSMLRLRWEVVADELAEARAEVEAPARRAKIRAVDPADVKKKPTRRRAAAAE